MHISNAYSLLMDISGSFKQYSSVYPFLHAISNLHFFTFYRLIFCQNSYYHTAGRIDVVCTDYCLKAMTSVATRPSPLFSRLCGLFSRLLGYGQDRRQYCSYANSLYSVFCKNFREHFKMETLRLTATTRKHCC